MNLVRIAAACLAASLALASVGARAQSLPGVAQAALAEQKAACAPEKASLDKGFERRRDVNGDGVPDVILDYGRFRCGDSASFFCGTAGCTQQVFASLPGGGYAKVLDDNVRDLAFRTINGRPAMVLASHGSGCGKSGADNCRTTLFWNGRTFRRGG